MHRLLFPVPIWFFFKSISIDRTGTLVRCAHAMKSTRFVLGKLERCQSAMHRRSLDTKATILENVAIKIVTVHIYI